MMQMLGIDGADATLGEQVVSAVRATPVDTTAASRVLILEPRSDALAHALRRAGFAGELWALLRRSIAHTSTAAQLRTSHDGIAYWDWSESLARLGGPAAATPSQVPAELGVFSAVIVNDVSRLVPADQLGPLLSSLASLLQARGCLFVCEPLPDVDTTHLEQRLLQDGLLLVSDPECIDDDWPRVLATFQKRGSEETHLIGSLRRVEWPALESNVSLQDAVIATYREVFGGDEWQEWVRCTRPGTNHHYSQREAALLSPLDRCLCGWSRPLQPFYTPDSILEKMHYDLARHPASCCYMRVSPDDTVEGFTWGYLADLHDVAHMLAAGQPGKACDEIHRHIASLVADVNADYAHTAGPSSMKSRIFYHSELGVRNSVRSLSLARGLFHRAFQFAYDQGASVVVLRTSITSPAYDISMGLGMRTLYRYTETSTHDGNGDHGSAAFTSTSDAGAARRRKVHRDLSSILKQEPDARVIVGGDLKRMLQFLGREPDRRLVMRMLHAKRNRSSD